MHINFNLIITATRIAKLQIQPNNKFYPKTKIWAQTNAKEQIYNLLLDPWNKKKRHKKQQKEIETDKNTRQLPVSGLLSLNQFL